MIKRSFALMLALCLLLTTTSSFAFAEDIEMTVEDVVLDAMLSEELIAEDELDIGESIEPEESAIAAYDDAGQEIETLEETPESTEDELTVVEDGKEDDTELVEESADIDEYNEAEDTEEASADEEISAIEETPTDVEETPAEVEEAPAEVEETPTEVEEAPAEVEETPTEVEEAPAETAEAPAVTEAPAAPVVEAPAETAEAPAVTETPVATATPAATEAPAAIETPAAVEATWSNTPLLAASIAQITLTKNTKYALNYGNYLQINLSGVTAKSYKTSNKKVASVTKSGLVKAKAAGKAKITVTLTNKKKLTLTLTVTDTSAPTAVYLSKDGVNVSGTINAAKGTPFTLTASAAPAGTAVTGYKWTSSNKKIATVNKYGVVTPKKVGTAKITVTTTRGNKKRTVKVKVTDPYKATSVKLNKTGLIYMTVKDTLQLTATMTTASGAASTSKLTWSSSNKKIATVSKYGKVTAKKKGTVTITVKTDSGKKAKVKIKVFAKAGTATSLTAEWSGLKEDNQVNPGELATYVISTSPLNANANLVWSVDNTDVAKVENYYRGDDLKFYAEVRAVDVGYTTLTATDLVSGISKTATVYVVAASAPTSISFPNLNNSDMTVGEKRDILYQVDPQDSLSHDSNRATVTYDGSILYIGYDKNNADRNCRGTMDYNLHIQAVGKGTTTVTVTLKNGVTNSFKITVK